MSSLRIPIVLFFLAASAALAQAPSSAPSVASSPVPSATALPVPSAAPASSSAESAMGPELNYLKLPWTGPTGRGFGLGMEEGGWSGGFGSGVRVKANLLGNLIVVLREAWVMGHSA